MGDEARRRRRDRRRESWRTGWRSVLLGKPGSAAATNREVPSGTPTTVLARLAVSWPRQLYRRVEERWRYAPSVGLFKLLLTIVTLVLVSFIGGVAALAALATGNAALDGFTIGVILGFVLLALALAYVGWGAFMNWFSRRRKAS
jgi:hypothetical protein